MYHPEMYAGDSVEGRITPSRTRGNVGTNSDITCLLTCFLQAVGNSGRPYERVFMDTLHRHNGVCDTHANKWYVGGDI